MFGNNALENVQQYMRENVQRIGEDFLGNLFDSLAANQDATISHIQGLQKWQAVKLIQKVITARFFPRECPNGSLNGSEFLRGVNRSILNAPLSRKKRPVAIVEIQVFGCDALLMKSWRSFSQKAPRWKAVIRTPHKTLETPHAVMLEHKGADPEAKSGEGKLGLTMEAKLGWAAVKTGLTRSSTMVAPETPRHSKSIVRWTEGATLRAEVYDFQTDLHVEIWNKVAKAAGDQSPMNPRALDDLSAFVGGPIGPLDVSTPQTSTPRSDPPRASAGDWELYGRVAIPLATLMEGIFDSRESNGVSGSLRAWYHLYPQNQHVKERKYVRPFSGYPGLGMLNPGVSLGFVDVGVKITSLYPYPTYSIPLISNMNSPEQVWFLPTTFDLQAFQAAGLRAHHLAYRPAKWLSRFSHLYSICVERTRNDENDSIPVIDTIACGPESSPAAVGAGKNFEDDGGKQRPRSVQLGRVIGRFIRPVPGFWKKPESCPVKMVALWWSLLFVTTVLLPVYLVPVGFFAIIFLSSYSYKIHPPASRNTLSFQCAGPIREEAGLEADYLGNANSGSKSRNPSPNPSSHRISKALGIRGKGAKPVEQWMEHYTHWWGVPRDAVLVNKTDFSPDRTNVLHGVFAGTCGAPLTTEGGELCPPFIESLLVGDEKTPRPPSSVGTVFGRADIGMLDPDSYDRVAQVFADDVRDVDLNDLRHMGFMVLEFVQLTLLLLTTFMEKVTISLSWLDRGITILTMSILAVLSLQISAAIFFTMKILSQMNTHTLRLFLFFLPVSVLLLLQDPNLQYALGLVDTMDRLAIRALTWQPDSHLIQRFAQNTWDQMYLLGMLSKRQRSARHQLMTCLADRSVIKNDSTSSKANRATGSPLQRLEDGLGSIKASVRAKESPSDKIRYPSSPRALHSSSGKAFKETEISIPRGLCGWMLWLLTKILALVCSPFLWEARFLFYWFMRIPDRREIEHRQICATQFLGPSLHPFIHCSNAFWDQSLKDRRDDPLCKAARGTEGVHLDGQLSMSDYYDLTYNRLGGRGGDAKDDDSTDYGSRDGKTDDPAAERKSTASSEGSKMNLVETMLRSWSNSLERPTERQWLQPPDRRTDWLGQLFKKT